MSAWDACTLEPNLWLRWIECHPGLAGYVQAVGSVAAILLALLAPAITTAWENYLHRRARLRYSRKLAGSMRNHVWDVESEVKRVRERLAYETPPEDVAEANLAVSGWRLKLPPQLDLLEEAAANAEPSLILPFLDVADAVRNYNNGLVHYTPDESALRADAWSALRETACHNLGLVHHEVERARRIAEKYSD